MKLLAKYAELYTAGSESPKRYHQWCIINSVAAMLGRNYYLPFGFNNIYPNIYTMLIGSPGAKKSTAIKAAVKLVAGAGYERVAANKTTKEKFLLDLYGHKDDSGATHQAASLQIQPSKSFTNLFGEATDEEEREPAEILIAADEFTNFVGAGNYEFISLLGELWDCPDTYINRVKNSKSFTINNPCVNILSGNTPTGFAAAFPPDILGQGFISRLLLVYGERTDIRNTFPSPPDAALKDELIAELAEIRATVVGEATISAEARAAIDWLYKNWEDLDDMRFQNYSSRRLIHLIKLCMVFAAMSKRTNIGIEDVVTANTLLTVTEDDMPRALGEFGKGKYAEVSNKILEYLLKINEPQTSQQIWEHVHMDIEKMQQLTDILVGLKSANKIQATPQGMLPVRKVKKLAGKYFDLTTIGGLAPWQKELAN